MSGALVILGYGLIFGVGVGIGLLLAAEIITRITGNGRVVLLTYTSAKHWDDTP